MSGSQPVEIPAGEVLVLGVQAQRVAPNTGVAGLVATAYVYRVQPGDTLESIAADYYGDAAYAWSLYQANSDVLGGSTQVTPGMLLALP
jgi:nucleoid-associated protein YgaU